MLMNLCRNFLGLGRVVIVGSKSVGATLPIFRPLRTPFDLLPTSNLSEIHSIEITWYDNPIKHLFIIY